MRPRVFPSVVIGVAAVVVVAVAVPVALTRHDTVAGPTARTAALSTTDRRFLAQERPAISALPSALSEVPAAASAAAHGAVTPTQAQAIIAATPALASLAAAIRSPESVTGTLIAGYNDVLAGRRPQSPDALEAALATLQTVEGDVGPAVRVVAAHARRGIGAAAALSAVEADTSARPLSALLAGWQGVYGAFTLVEQAAASS